ncbi:MULTISPECIES: hydantoinase/oxoprolinase family protein [unclassified Bradyrhizobium]|uniref:hydantoinase/oxoprolinase family protein n=1 Tax=unclassified Bradyrhizobium TaxID=2631580 RepID=UPI0024799F2F|nr:MULTISPECIES: hydantoinase/oxoprolinase family protein [unclassified Bradyrhizobium]WGS19203.1 hydantoinase/oxoprolinase family protein [Bradyrhizobium sp. ISRA463]WGS26039.1 hydantoinase/oxoprolinase family protein [Bradyrhizobium sp. ISRA464]
MREPSTFLAAPWRIGVDVGGTFTDMVLRDAKEYVRIFKAPSITADPSEGVLNVLRRAAAELDLPVSALLRNCALFVHGSTVATNTILEKKGARVGMLTTHGFRDSLEIRRGIRENQWDHRAPPPQVLVPRYLRQPVRGRIAADGTEAAPLAAEDVAKAADIFKQEGVEAVAVCLFNSFLDGRHEYQAREALAKSWGGDWISLSSDIMPTIGEYERGSTAVVNAYVAPKVTRYLKALDERLRELGLPRSLLMLQSNGGAVSVMEVANRPVMLVLSGPAAAVGALKGCASSQDLANFISMEIGGTSCDVMVMAKGEVPVRDQLVIDGYHLTTPSVEIHTVGAGGGTIAWVDSAGLLNVGPKGAGAQPGPAAYGLGGEEPTVTDAQLVLGRMREGPLAGGTVKLDLGLARHAIETKLARPLGLSVEDAAAGVIRLLEQNLLHAVERLSIERGHNPAHFTLVAAGGAGPMHGSSVARSLGCKRALLPRAAGAFCAMGALQSDVRQDYLHVFVADLDKVDRSALEAGFAQLEARARDSLARQGFADKSAIQREIDLRYAGQQWPVRVALEGNRFHEAAVRQAFEAEHQRLFGHIQPGGRLEIRALRVVGRGHLEWSLPPMDVSGQETPMPRLKRPVWIDSTRGWQDIPVYDGEDLRPGCKLQGPLLIEERTTTAFVGPSDIVEVNAAADFLVHIGAAA